MARKKSKIRQAQVAIPEVVGEITPSIVDVLSRWVSSELLYKAQERGLIAIHENKVKYIVQGKAYRVTDPEEAVRLAFYLELIDRYQYPPERIDLEVEVPGRTPDVQADIVVFEDDAKKKPYIVVECKKDGISPAELTQADKQAIGNANALRSKYCILVAGTIRIARDVAGFAQDEREKNIIADIPVRYGKVIKFRYKRGDAQWDLQDVTKDELLAKFQQCHDALWEGGKRNPAEAFDEMSKLMYCKIQDERFLTEKGNFYRFQVGTYETANEVGERIRGIYKDAQKIDPKVFVEPIKADNAVVYTVVEILQGISLTKTDLDVKGEGYEHFLGGVFRGAMGQYFTPRPIVSFMVNFLEPTRDDFVIDPACGSGGFLIYTLEKMRKELHEKLDPHDALDRWKDFALKQVYGIEINSQLARVSMMNMIIHQDGHTNIENGDALDNPETWKLQDLKEYFGKKFSLLMTNPPFGASVKEREKAYLANYELGGKIKKRNRQNTEILFIERCLDFLRPGGRMGIVLPDGILTNSSLQYVRDFITERTQILGVVSLPQTAFKRPSSKGSGDTGSGVKASLLFLRKKRPGERLSGNYPIFMAIAEHIGYDATGRPDKDEFPDILKAWQEFRKTNKIDFFVKAPLSFAIGRAGIEGRIDPSYHRPEYRTAYEKLSKYNIKELKDLTESIVSGITPKAKGPAYASKVEGIPFIRSGDLRDDNTIDYNECIYIKREIHEEEMKSSQLHKNDLLMAIVGATIGKVSLFKDKLDANINQAIARLRFKEGVNEEYVLYYLRSKLGQEQLNRLKRPVARANINLSEIAKIKVPLPPRRIQDKIASIMDEAYRLKKEKEAEAEKLLSSIDEYVLNELSIKLNGGKEEKVYSISFDKISGKRFDPYSHKPTFQAAASALENGKYSVKNLGELIADISGGATPKAKGESYTGPDGIPFLRIQNVTPDGISFEDMNYINEETHERLLKRSQLKAGDVVFTITGRIGTTAVIPEDWKRGNINQHIARLRFNKDIFPEYFAAFFNTQFGNQQALRLASGGSRIALDYTAIRSLKIPLPPLSIQQKIAEEVTSRRERAKKLNEEAKEILAKAKEKVEKMILGKAEE
jgi:type I restriction enzyme M protein